MDVVPSPIENYRVDWFLLLMLLFFFSKLIWGRTELLPLLFFFFLARNETVFFLFYNPLGGIFFAAAGVWFCCFCFFGQARWTPVSVPTLWGFPNEPPHLHGLQKNSQLDRVVVNAGGPRVEAFDAIAGMNLVLSARDCGLRIDSDSPVPASDHYPIIAVLDVGISLFGRLLNWVK